MKQFWFSYISSLVLLVVFLMLILWIFNPYSQKRGTLRIPLPSSLTLAQNKQVSTLALWLPLVESFFSPKIQEPQISAKATLVYDIMKNKTLYSKNPRERLPMASLTKIMTAVIGLENRINPDIYTVLPQHLVGENSMGVTAYETFTFDELLYGLILVSGNDAAEVIAGHHPQGRDGFIKAMNDKAKALGITDTNFTNPSGLEGDGDQYTTVYDLLIITKYAIDTYPQFTKVTSTFQHTLPYSENHKAFFLENETNLLTSYEGVKGVKTGFTQEAGLCLVTYLDYKGHKIIGVILGSNNRREEMKELLDYTLMSQGVEPPARN